MRWPLSAGAGGKPVYVPESSQSWSWRTEIWCQILWMAGFRDADRVFIPFGYNVYVAFWEGHYAAEKLGCLVVPGGALDTLSLKFETREEIEQAPLRMLVAQLAERLKIRTNLRFNLQPVKYRDLPRYTLKAKRFKDLR